MPERGDRATGSPPEWVWPALAVVAALAAMRGAFTLTEIFYVRDLAAYSWPLHLALRASVASADFPLWDATAGLGQSAVANPVRQLLFLPSLPLRLLLPTIPGYNLWVAMPFPLAAAGAYAFLRRHATGPAASLGAATAI